jgi:hypothetical protein
MKKTYNHLYKFILESGTFGALIDASKDIDIEVNT